MTTLGALRLGAGCAYGVIVTVADEQPVAVSYNAVPHVVLMATPADLADLAIGFSITEGLCTRDEIRAVTTKPAEFGHAVDVVLAPAAFSRFLKDRPARQTRSYTSCGICGVESVAARPRHPDASAKPATRFDTASVRAALQALPDHQPLNRATGALHAAAWASPGGQVVAVREDVGRHNALDKLIGALSEPAPGFCVITSRCSYEMVQKAVAAGFELLVAISAPTALAIAEAGRLGLTLVALARADTQTVYAGADRLTDSADQLETIHR